MTRDASVESRDAPVDDGRAVQPADAFLDRVDPGDRERVMAAVDRAIETEGPCGVEYRTSGSDDREWVETWFAVVDDTEPESVLQAITHDVTGRKRRLERLERENQRLSASTTGLARDLRTPLKLAQRRLARAREAQGADDADDLAEVAAALDRMAARVDELAASARDDEPAPTGRR